MRAHSTTVLLTPGALGADGLSRLARETSAALSALPGGDVSVLSLMDDGSGALDGTRVQVRGAGGRRLRYAGWALREGLRVQRERVVVSLHAHLAPLALPWLGRGTRFVHVVVGIESWKHLTRVQSVALRRADLLLAISRHSADRFREANPAFRDRDIAVCHPGIAPRDQPPSVDDGYALIVGRMARDERYKGHDHLLELWPALQDRLSGAQLYVIGDGDDRARLEAKSRELGLEGSVRFLGRVDEAELGELYRRCSFFVMPSRLEGFGFVFLEAMRAAKPCIGSPGAASEIIDDGVTGFIVDPDNVERLSRKMERLWRHPEKRVEMGIRGRKRFLERFTSERFQVRLHDAMASLTRTQGR